MNLEEEFGEWFARTFSAPIENWEFEAKDRAKQAYLEGARKQKQEDVLQAMVDNAQELGLYDEPPAPKKLNPVTLAAGKLLKRRR